MIMNNESIIRFYLNLFIGIPNPSYIDPTQIQINFSDEDESEPYLLQGGYDFEIEGYWIALNQLNNHFIFDTEYYCNNVKFFNDNFIKMYKNIVASGEVAKEMLIIENGKNIKCHKFTQELSNLHI